MALSSESPREPLLRLRSYLPGGDLGRKYAGDDLPLQAGDIVELHP